MNQLTNPTPNQKQNCCSPGSACCGKTWLMVLAIIVAFVAGGLIYAWQQKAIGSILKDLQTQITNLQNQVMKEEVPATSNPTTDETAGWKTYKNDQYGFEVKYPSSWPAPSEKGLFKGVLFNTTFRQNVNQSEDGFSISINNYSGSWIDINGIPPVPLQPTYTRGCENNYQRIIKDTRVGIGNYATKEVYVPAGDTCFQEWHVYYISNGGYIFEITPLTNINFSSILATFKFTK
jgi:hypothetical protein